MPKVSICTSVLNQPEYLARMIASVQAQTYQDWELVIVDDGSPIPTIVPEDPRIRLIRWDENKGIPHGLNYAFTQAQGDYVQPLSADEFISPTKLADQTIYLEAHPEIGCVWGLPGKGEFGERPSWEQYALKAHNRSREAWIRTLLRLESIPIGGASMLMRTRIMGELGGFDPEFFHCSDLEMFVRFFWNHEGRVLPYRWADADQPNTRLTAPSPENTVKFHEDLKRLHAKHKIILPPSGRVTVCIPVFNMAQYIGKTIESLKAQTIQDFDMIILDDASTDNLDDALIAHLEFLETHHWNHIKFLENLGVRHALNAMIGHTTTEFFVSVAADDWIEPTYLERALNEFTDDPFLEFVASQTDFVDKDGKELPPLSNDLQRIERACNKTREQWLHRLYYGNVYFGVGMYRTYALREIGGFDVEAGVLTDYDVYLKLLQRENIKIIEENLSHTRVHEQMASYGVNKFTPQWLREKYAEIKRRYYVPRMKVIICTPFYEMKGFSPYIHAMVYTIQLLTLHGIQFEFWELSGDSYVDRAKNTLFNKFLEDPEATDLFMIDSDMQWNPDAIVKMLMLPEQIVIGSYPQKNSWHMWTSAPALVPDAADPAKQHPIGRVLADGSALLKSQYLSGGFMRVKRDVLMRFKEKYKDEAYQDGAADPSNKERVYTNFFICEVKDGLRWGEDRVFGKKLAEMGEEVWIYPNIELGHYGVKGWHGNFDRFLRNPVVATDTACVEKVA